MSGVVYKAVSAVTGIVSVVNEAFDAVVDETLSSLINEADDAGVDEIIGTLVNEAIDAIVDETIATFVNTVINSSNASIANAVEVSADNRSGSSVILHETRVTAPNDAATEDDRSGSSLAYPRTSPSYIII